MEKATDMDNAGRIPKKDFFISTLALLIVSLISTLSRLYIRIFIQRECTIDDAFIVIGFCCLVGGFAIFYTIAEEQYLVEDLTYNGATAFLTAPSDWSEKVINYQREIIKSLLCTWAAIVCVKLSFIFFFRKLVERIRSMMIFWWVILVFNLAVCGYGFSVYVLACPSGRDIEFTGALPCGFGSKANHAINLALSQMVLGILSDLMILAIPIRLIWKVEIRWTQKLTLALSLCLTIVMISVSIIRVSGLRHGTSLDSGWEVYWQIISGEVGITLTAVTAFRTLLVSHRVSNRERERASLSSKMSTAMKKVVTWPSWLSGETGWGSKSYGHDEEGHHLEPLPMVPDAKLTGVRTFIEGQSVNSQDGFERVDTRGSSGEQVLQTLAEEEQYPIREPPRAIKVRQEVWSTSDRVSHRKEEDSIVLSVIQLSDFEAGRASEAYRGL